MTTTIPTDYRKAYDRGWRYSSRETATLDHGDANHEPDAWYDGYLDLAAGREKFHSFTCREAGACAEHSWGGFVQTANGYVLCTNHAQAWRLGGNDVAFRRATDEEVAEADGCCDCLEERLSAALASAKA